MTAAKYDALVAGAGIVGAACALELARAGMKVAVADPRPPGSGATAAGMGHVVVLDDSEAQFALTRYSQALWDALADRLPRGAEFMRCGTTWVAADEEEMAAAEAKRAFHKQRGVGMEMLDARRLRECEPNLRPDLPGGLFAPGDSVLYPPPVADAFLGEVIRRGGRVFRAAVAEWTGEGARLADGSVVHARATVNAAGHWSPSLDPGLPVRPKKGHLVITDRYPGFVRSQVIELGYIKSAHAPGGDSVAFNVQPRPTGQMLIGSSRQYGRDDNRTDHDILARMLRRAVEYLPALSPASAIRAWTGIRAATNDGLPLIGPHDALPNHWLATGHEGLGITTSLGTAKILAALMMGTEPAIPADPYLPSRPAIRGDRHG